MRYSLSNYEHLDSIWTVGPTFITIFYQSHIYSWFTCEISHFLEIIHSILDTIQGLAFQTSMSILLTKNDLSQGLGLLEVGAGMKLYHLSILRNWAIDSSCTLWISPKSLWTHFHRFYRRSYLYLCLHFSSHHYLSPSSSICTYWN